MKHVEEILQKKSDKKLITYKDLTLTQTEFSVYVESLAEQVRDVPVSGSGFILVEEEHPVHFFALVFAIWKTGGKVVFPNRDFMDRKTNFSFYEYAVSVRAGSVISRKNPDYHFRVEDPRADAIVFSSGSTGKPKGIVHNRNNLFGNAMGIHNEKDRYGYTSLTALKPYLVSGISHFLVHYMSDSHLVFIDLEDIDRINDICPRYENANIVGSPMHIIMSASKMDASFTPGFFFTSGDFIYASSIQQILGKFPGATFYKVYGIAEIGGRFFVNPIDRNTDISRYDLIGHNIRGTEYRTEDGQMYVRSDYTYYGYIIDDTFVPSQEWHPSGDLVRETKNGLVLYGRTDDEIKVGGNKVSLKHIEGKVMNLLKGDIAIVVSMSHDVLGNLICLVLQSEKSYARSELMGLLRSSLEAHEMPHKYFRIDEIPYTQTMKIDRKAIAARIEDLSPIK